MQHMKVIKVGGKVLEEQKTFDMVVDALKQLDDPKILVHGGGNVATELAGKLGQPVKMIEGKRVTDKNMLDTVLMVYGGLLNKKLVAAMQARGMNAMGLTGADVNIIQAEKRPVLPVDYGLVGDIASVNTNTLSHLVQMGYIPVLAPLTHDGKGQMLNTNADSIASEVAKALVSHFRVELIFCFDKPGVLMDVNDETTVLHEINSESYRSMSHKGQIADGMIPKLESSFKALHSGVNQIFITNVFNLGKKNMQGTVVKL